MRLLHTTTLRFEEFFEDQRPPYAILSNSWGADESSYKDLSKGRNRRSAGNIKVLQFCKFAVARDHEWVWIDTCCIDKRSSAELSEAINSMFKWYYDADICYAYLVDVPPTADPMDTFPQSTWFSRGWTLQELLAPAQVFFCDAAWNIFGNKHSKSGIIAAITMIHPRYFSGRGLTHTASIATRMSWFSTRQTTRREDVAYCMLGIFDVNMPLLYGEGNKAFLRLQTEIMRKSNDQTIFVWGHGLDDSSFNSMLASSPKAFANSGTLVRIVDRGCTYGMTQRGFEVHVPYDAWVRPPGELEESDGLYGDLLCELGLDCEGEVEGVRCVPCLVFVKNLDTEAERKLPWLRCRISYRPHREVRELRKLNTDGQDATLLIAQDVL